MRSRKKEVGGYKEVEKERIFTHLGHLAPVINALMVMKPDAHFEKTWLVSKNASIYGLRGEKRGLQLLATFLSQ